MLPNDDIDILQQQIETTAELIEIAADILGADENSAKKSDN